MILLLLHVLYFFLYFHFSASRAVWCLVHNPAVRLDFHLQQLLPAIFTCVVAYNLCPQESSSLGNESWTLRVLAGEVISCICLKYSYTFPDLQVTDIEFNMICLLNV